MSSKVSKMRRDRARDALRNLEPTSVMDLQAATAQPWGGDRNLLIRVALGIRYGEICLMNQSDVLQLVVTKRERADKLARYVSRAFPYADVIVTRRSDKRHVVQAEL